MANTSPPYLPSPAPGSTPDPLAGLSSTETQTELVQQIQQNNEIVILQEESPYNIVVEGVLGGLPVAEKNQEYFAVVFEAGDTSPEIIDQTQFKVTYLCDSILNVSKPSEASVALHNITQNFERQKNATIRVDQGTVLNQQLGGTHKITAVGSLEPIGGTQIGTGPREYVTTMSFQLNDQLGTTPGLKVAPYYMWLNKSVGFQNKLFSRATGGTITYTGNAWSYGNQGPLGSQIFEASPDVPLRLSYDSEQVDSGSAVNKATTGPVPTNFDSANYFDRIDILTGSIEGNTRIKIRGSMAINVATSSIADLYLSAYYGENYPPEFPSYVPVTMNIYRSGSSNGIELLTSGIATTYIKNSSLGTGGNLNFTTGQFKQGILPVGFNWTPTTNDGSPVQFSGIEIESDYFTANEGDHIYAEIVAPEESTSSLSPTLASPPQSGPIFNPDEGIDDTNSDGVLYFTESLNYWRNEAALRKYQYYGGFLIINQETPEGNIFIQGVTGVTASYFSGSSPDLTQTVYNYTGSYWVNYNNFSSSEDGIGSYITSSTALANFYGGEYYQINPGTEEYNVVNAEGSVSSSLYVNGLTENDKKTWNKFGFNPIRLSFTPKAGDFIRFEYSKQKVFQIIGVFSFGNVLKLKLNKQIDPATVLDNFVIYRIVEDGQYIILDVEKNNEAGVDQPFSGVITAEYRSENLQRRTDELLFDLKQAGIIQDGNALS